MERFPMISAVSTASDRYRRVALVVGGLALALAGCAQKVDQFETTGAVSDDYRVNHPITIEEQVETLDVPVSVDTAQLTGAMRANVAFFARNFIASGTAIIAVVAPSGSPNQVAAASVAVEIEHVLRQSGVNPRAIDYRVYKADAAEKVAPVRIAYNRIAAVTAPCGQWTDQVIQTEQNRHYGSFGCAAQQNFAAMVDNPLDLLYPRGMTPPDAARRATVLEKYRRGEVFSSDNSGMIGGSVATGVGQ
jgi:pilus assembly protein CpaD